MQIYQRKALVRLATFSKDDLEYARHSCSKVAMIVARTNSPHGWISNQALRQTTVGDWTQVDYSIENFKP